MSLDEKIGIKKYHRRERQGEEALNGLVQFFLAGSLATRKLPCLIQSKPSAVLSVALTVQQSSFCPQNLHPAAADTLIGRLAETNRFDGILHRAVLEGQDG